MRDLGDFEIVAAESEEAVDAVVVGDLAKPGIFGD